MFGRCKKKVMAALTLDQVKVMSGVPSALQVRVTVLPCFPPALAYCLDLSIPAKSKYKIEVSREGLLFKQVYAIPSGIKICIFK